MAPARTTCRASRRYHCGAYHVLERPVARAAGNQRVTSTRGQVVKTADILRTKGSDVITIGPDRPIREAMSLLVDHNIGALVVFDDRLHGIITERDLLRAAASDLQRLASARVRDLMTTEVITTTADSDIGHVMDIMTERRIRHLPVVAGASVCGMISIGDVVSALRQHVESENRQLHAYITGSPA